MKHFGIFVSDLESESFLASSNDQIATWLFLHALCSKTHNGGIIQSAACLPDKYWSRHGISADIITKPSPLWAWHGDDLHVSPYDIDGEALYLRKSAGGKLGNQKRWKGTDNRTPNRTPNPPDQTRPDLTKIKRQVPAPAFEKPTLEMVRSYGLILEPKFTKAENFLDHYEANGWKVGKNPMKDWKAAVRNWNRNETPTSKPKPSKADEFKL